MDYKERKCLEIIRESIYLGIKLSEQSFKNKLRIKAMGNPYAAEEIMEEEEMLSAELTTISKNCYDKIGALNGLFSAS